MTLEVRMKVIVSHANTATYLLIVRPKVTWTSAIRVFLTHLNTEGLKGECRQSVPHGTNIRR